MYFLLREVIKEALASGIVPLYHFSRATYPYPEKLTLHPDNFSKTEKLRSNIPRVFFYPDTPTHAYEDTPSIRFGRQLYKTSMMSSQIYNMIEDPEGFVAAGRNSYGFMDQDKVLGEIREKYPAAYMEGRFPVVLVFNPIEVTLVHDDEKQALMSR
jgi:hypothetical protein